MSAPKPTLGYWNIRGLAQVIRLMLKYKEVDFENLLYGNEGVPEWKEVKFTLGLDLPNLPYYIDGEHKITESGAIIKYLARKYNLGGVTEAEAIRSDMAFGAHLDDRMACVRTFYNPKFAEVKGDLEKTIPDRVEKHSKYLGDRKFIAGDNITYGDFCVYDLLDILRNFMPGCLDKHDNLKAYMDRFEALPTVKAYMDSDEYLKKPFNGKSAGWGGDA